MRQVVGRCRMMSNAVGACGELCATAVRSSHEHVPPKLGAKNRLQEETDRLLRAANRHDRASKTLYEYDQIHEEVDGL